jgi:K+-transporting ATPase B subunit
MLSLNFSAEAQREPGRLSLPVEELRSFAEVFGAIKSGYVESVEDKKLINGAINGMLSDLDPHSAYLDPEAFKELQVGTQGEFGGLGIEVGMEDGFVRVVSPIEDTPAFRAGLKPGDLIIKLDDTPVKGMTLNDAVKKMRGKPKSPIRITTATELRKGDVVLVETGDVIPADGEVLEGVASVDESAITGESAPVIRESGGDFSSVTGGTRVLSDWIVVRVTANPGEAFLDRMIAMVEGAKRQKTPNEIALTILLVALTIVMLLATATLLPFSMFSVEAAKAGHVVTITALVALLVCLIPTTIGGLLSAIGVAGMSRMMQANVIATSGRAVEAAGDVDVLLLDKTGTITLGNRQASQFVPAPGLTEEALADAAQLSSLADETPEGRSIVVLAKQRFNIRQRDMASLKAEFLAFTAQTRMSGVDIPLLTTDAAAIINVPPS